MKTFGAATGRAATADRAGVSELYPVGRRRAEDRDPADRGKPDHDEPAGPGADGEGDRGTEGKGIPVLDWICRRDVHCRACEQKKNVEYAC